MAAWECCGETGPHSKNCTVSKIERATVEGNPVGAPTALEAITEQESKYGGASDGELFVLARDAFDEAAAMLHEGIASGSMKHAINRAYRRSGEGRAALEVVARRAMRVQIHK